MFYQYRDCPHVFENTSRLNINVEAVGTLMDFFLVLVSPINEPPKAAADESVAIEYLVLPIDSVSKSANPSLTLGYYQIHLAMAFKREIYFCLST